MTRPARLCHSTPCERSGPRRQTRQLHLGKSRHDFKQVVGGSSAPGVRRGQWNTSLGRPAVRESPDTTLVMLTQAIHGNLRENKSITGHTSVWLCLSPAWCGRAANAVSTWQSCQLWTHIEILFSGTNTKNCQHLIRNRKKGGLGRHTHTILYTDTRTRTHAPGG